MRDYRDVFITHPAGKNDLAVEVFLRPIATTEDGENEYQADRPVRLSRQMYKLDTGEMEDEPRTMVFNGQAINEIISRFDEATTQVMLEIRFTEESFDLHPNNFINKYRIDLAELSPDTVMNDEIHGDVTYNEDGSVKYESSNKKLGVNAHFQVTKIEDRGRGDTEGILLSDVEASPVAIGSFTNFINGLKRYWQNEWGNGGAQ